MSLPREVWAEVAAAYGLGLVLEELRAACDPSDVLASPLEFVPRLHAHIDELFRLSRSDDALPDDLSKRLSFFRGAVPPPFTPVTGWGHVAADTLSGLHAHVTARIGPRLRDQLDALLVLLLVEQREQGRQKPRRARSLAPWVGVDARDVEEMLQSRALSGLAAYSADPRKSNEWAAGEARLTVDGRLVAESLLEGEAAPTASPVVEPAHARPAAMPARIEGTIERLEIRNVFSFGGEAQPIELGRLNLLIGANGSGKSNVLEAIELLASTPRDVQAAIREAGGIYDVLSRRIKQEGLVGSIEAVVAFMHLNAPIRHRLDFTAEEQRFKIVNEQVQSVHSPPVPPFFTYGRSGPIVTVLSQADKVRRVEPVQMPATRSILSERRDPARYPELADLAALYQGLRSYREPLLGRLAAPRAPQPTDLPNDQLLADGSNLALVLSRLRLDPPTKDAIVEKLRYVYASVDDIDTKTEGGTIQVFLQDGGVPLPARRISDGTMRFLCLLVVLCNPSPPPIVLIEEPELGLHPDAIGALADLLRDASERTQLIVTTHSEALVDRFSDTPEAVLVVDKDEPAEGGSTRVRRLDRESLKEWLDQYSLGRLWRMGELGGNRW